MKKISFFSMLMLLFVALFGQALHPAQFSSAKRYNAPLQMAGKETQMIPAQHPSTHVPHAKSGWWSVGETYWNAITNGSARNTAGAHASGDMANVWTFLNDQGVRGTGYNWFDQASNSWGPNPSERIEKLEPGTGNPGYPCHAFTKNGEIAVAHVAAKACLMISTREKRGEGEWTQTEITDPTYPSGFFWPTMSTSGDTVHIVAVYDCTYGSNLNNPVYFRSTDGGKTWDIKAYTLPEMPQDEKDAMFADQYTIVSRGNHVVFAWLQMDNSNYVGKSGNIGYIESLDGGNTWTYKPVYDCNFDFATAELVPPAFLPRSVAAAIDDNDVVHIAFGGSVWSRDAGTQVGWGTQYLYYGIMYWKSTQNTLTQKDFGIEYTMVDSHIQVTAAGYESFPNFINIPDVLGFQQFYFWGDYFPFDLIVGYNTSNEAVIYPHMVAEGGKVYLLYGSIVEDPMIYSGETPAFYRGVFLTVSDDNGDSFDQTNRTSWISYNRNYFFCDWSNYKGPVVENQDSVAYDGEILIEIPSDNTFSTMALNSGGGNLLIQWANTYYPGELQAGEMYGIMSLVLDKDMAGVYNNTREVWKGLWDNYNFGVKDVKGGIQDMRIFPNPAQNVATVLVNSICSKPYTLTVTNIMGQSVYTQNGNIGYGENRISLNINNLTPGIYLVNIKTDNATRTQKLIVK